MRLCLLASGSNGNACFLEAAGRRVLVDVGIGPVILTRRLAPLGLSPADITDVLLTHEHVDHVRGLPGLIKRQPEVRIHATAGTRAALPEAVRQRTAVLAPGRGVRLGALQVFGLPISHDAAEPVAYRIETPEGAVGYATDLGRFDDRLVEKLSGLRALVLESNHCPTLLARGPYPPHLKARVAGPDGHLSNQQALYLLERLLHPNLGYAVLAHLSGTNNHPAEVRRVFKDLLTPLGSEGWSVGSRSGPLAPAILEGAGPAQTEQSRQMTLPLEP